MRAIPQIVDELAGERRFALHVKGSCMAPHLLAGQKLLVEHGRGFFIGDILVVRDPLDRLLVHRAIGIYWRRGRWRFLTKADHGTRPDVAATADRVLGRVVRADGIPVRIRPQERARALWCFARFAARRIFHLGSTGSET